MKIGIVSDLHGNIDAWQTIINGTFKDVDKVLIAGDIYGAGLADPFAPWYQPQKLQKQVAYSNLPLFCIRGNCDSNTPYPETEIGEIFGNKYYMCHGQQQETNRERAAVAKNNNAAYFIYGHTHIWQIDKVEGVYIINPGSPTVPNKEPKHYTVALIDNDWIKIVDIHSQEVLFKKEHLHD